MTGLKTMYFFPHSQESFTETKPAFMMSAVRGADIWRLERDDVTIAEDEGGPVAYEEAELK